MNHALQHEAGKPLVGVLAYQGDFERHIHMLHGIGASTREVRTPEQLSGVDAAIIPGGESTTIGMLMERYGVAKELQSMAAAGMPVFGTCAGLILLASEILNSRQPRLSLLPITVERNAYGRQLESFEAELSARGFSEQPLQGVFIRAPRVCSVAPEVDVLASFEGYPILLRYGRILGASFHPELTTDTRVHRYFLEMIEL